jgi:NAD(P)-dependent dehydrogenase (short-subunit alcohol dehydrogenase family)
MKRNPSRGTAGVSTPLAVGQLARRVAIVTGAGSGLGQEISREFARHGASVACVDINADGAQATASKINSEGGTAREMQVDITKKPEVQECVQAVISEFHRIDILVNCAGISFFIDPTELTPEQWDHTFAVNLDGAWQFCQAVMPVMKANHYGKIVNIASAAGLMGMPKAPHYVASKHGLIGLTRALAADLGPYGINVNAICPGATLTPMQTRSVSDVFREESLKRYPLGRLGQPGDIANAALFLASGAADWITGVALPVDGGLLCCIRAHHWE